MGRRVGGAVYVVMFSFLFINRNKPEIMLRLIKKEGNEERFCYLRDCWCVCVYCVLMTLYPVLVSICTFLTFS